MVALCMVGVICVRPFSSSDVETQCREHSRASVVRGDKRSVSHVFLFDDVLVSMMAVIYKIGLILLFFVSGLFYANSIKLNVPRVLLPFSKTVSVNFTLEVTDGGCFKWYISRPEIIRIYVLDTEERGCASKAIVSSTSKLPTQQSALVTIINEVTRESLHCDVAVTSIVDIEITSTTRELLLEDTPEAFTVRAKDKDGDTFSSIDGLLFEWAFITSTDNRETENPQNVLRFMKFSESLYKASPAVYALEAQNIKGYTVLVQGIKTGTAIVRATLIDDAYPKLLSTEVQLAVVANLVLFPSYEVRIVAGSILKYHVHLIQHGKPQRIPMPSKQFYLEVGDNSVVDLDPLTSEVEALSFGYTTIVLKDRNIEIEQSFRRPSAGIHVVSVHHIGFTVLPHQNWHLIFEREYTIIVKLYDSDNNEIYNTDNVRITATFPKDYFTVKSDTANGTYYHVLAKKIGTTSITAKLSGILRKRGDMMDVYPPVEGSQEVEIMDKVYILPDLVILPWNPLTKPTYKVHLEVYGGGNYKYHWKTQNPNVATVNELGDVVSRSNGSVNITAASSKNPNDYGVATIMVLSPYTLEIMDSAVEVSIGNTIRLPVALHTYVGSAKSSKLAFTECTQYPINVESRDTKKLQYLSNNQLSTLPGSCVLLPFYAVAEGFIEAVVSFTGQEGEVRASKIIGVYKPLTMVSRHHSEDTIILAVGSSAQVAFEGGPNPWYLRPQGHFRNVRIANDTVASVMAEEVGSKSKDFYVFTVLCRELGETVAFIHVGNHESSTNLQPVTAEADIRVVCAAPAVIELRPVIPRPRGRSENCHFEQHRASSYAYRDVDLEVLLRDQEGRFFDNFTSLFIEWGSSNERLATISDNVSFHTIENVYEGYKTLNRSYQVLTVNGLEGMVKVSATVIAYQQEMLRSQGILSSLHLDAQIVTTLYMDLVEDAHFSESAVSVFNHPQNTVSLFVKKGSGQFDYEPKDQTIASVLYDEKLRQFKISPKTDGSFTLSLYDVCLEGKKRPTAVVHVSGIKKVVVKVVDKVGLDKEVVASVNVLDQDGNFLPSTVFHLLDVQPRFTSDIISVRPIPEASDIQRAFKFVIAGKALGHTSLVFTASPKLTLPKFKTDEIASDPHSIQVFPPLQLYPKNVTLIIGALFQVTSKGGPHPQVNIEFSIENSEIAAVNGAGLVEGLSHGQSVIVGRAIGVDSETGNRIVYSQAQVSVYIIPLSGIQIVVPLSRVQVGTIMPVYAFGVNEQETPFAFGSCKPSLIFKWSVSNKEIAALTPLYQECGINLPDSNQFMMRLVAKQQGQLTLSLRVSISMPLKDGSFQVKDNIALDDEIQVYVYEKLQLIAPPMRASEIIVTPSTTLNIISNKDQTSHLAYHISGSTCGQSDEGIQIDESGNLRSGQSVCQAMLLVTSDDEISGQQAFSSLVLVKPISYMMIVAFCSLSTRSEPLAVLPVGTATLFQAKFFDNTGKEFHAASSRLAYSLSRNDLVQVVSGTKNGTFYLKANNAGLTVLRAWDAENPSIEDYILVVTGEVIEPPKATLTLGDRICFGSPLVSKTGSRGTWHSDNPVVLKLDSVTGMGLAADVGTSTVTHNVSQNVVTSTDVTVVPIRSIEFGPSILSAHLSNAHPGRETRFPIYLHKNIVPKSPTSFSNLYGSKNCNATDATWIPVPFHCVLRPSNASMESPLDDIFEVREAFNFVSGVHECVVKTKSSSSEFQKLSSFDARLDIQAVVGERPKQEKIISQLVSIPFVPAFYVHQKELRLGGSYPSQGVIEISATPEVFTHLTLKPNDSTLQVLLPSLSDAKNPNVRLYPVQLSEDYQARLPDKAVSALVTVWCGLTEQEVPISVRLFGDGQERCVPEQQRTGWRGLFHAFVENYQNSLILILSIICTIIAAFIGYHALMGQKYYAAGPQSGVYMSPGPGGEGRYYPAGTPGFNRSYPNERPHLWSVNEPVHGSPSFQRTPSPNIHNISDRF